MLFEARLPKHFWDKVLYTIVHVINLNPTVALNTEVLDKIWFSKDVKYDHLRVFGCKVCTHVQKDERSKLDMKTRQCIFTGYGQDEYDGFNVLLDDDTKEEQEMLQDENLGDAPKPPPVQLGRSNRERQSFTRYISNEYVTLANGEEPKCYQEAMESEERQKWLDAMQDEINSLHDNHTYDLVKLSNGKKMSSIRIVLSLAATFDLEVK
ncbi:hypothetical protein CR513_49344, partial [Mucuna pruriens]